MFTKFAPIAVLLGAPLLSSAAPALFGIGGGATATVTIFQCPSASPSAASSSSVSSKALPSPSAVIGGALAAAQATQVLNGLKTLGTTLGGVKLDLSGLLGSIAGPTGLTATSQGKINDLVNKLKTATSNLNALTTPLKSLGSGGASVAAGTQIATSLDDNLRTISDVADGITTLNNDSDDSTANMSGVQPAVQGLLNACLANRDLLTSQCPTTALKQATTALWNTAVSKLTACSENDRLA